jgi:riboflavin kinase
MDILTLTTIAKQACHRAADVSSGKLARELKVSQQTASRRIKDLESKGHITREILPRGQRVRLTSKGIEVLRRLHLDLEKALKDLDSCIYNVTGEVVSGMGEGKYYMELTGYKKQFKKRLGFTPYPGTLNLKLKSAEDIRGRQILSDLQGIEIKGFKSGERTFGPVKCFMAKIDGIEGAVIIPMRTHHGANTLEVIAPENVRDKIGLNDGDTVTIKVIT